ncbi:MAG: ADP-ribosylglycohydrolase family protein [Lentisphaerae bacterium]|nr:ADP-ribosylglycohydrolase family protein [Lentisphaerota bacterium]
MSNIPFSYANYRDKVLAAWLGKSMGGVTGAALENQKQFHRLPADRLWPDVLPANDDLDIQLVWLEALQERGLYLTSRDLAEFWQDRCAYNFCEYGIFLHNIQRGIPPPLSGTWNNSFFRESEGCPIRAEIWGLIAPGNPELAAQLAKTDGRLDHGGAAVEIEQFLSAAIAQALMLDNLDHALAAGMAILPVGSPVASAIPEVRRICRQYPDPFQAWRMVIRKYGDRDASKAITNHAIVLMSLFLGRMDFKTTIELCLSSGWDTDCTAATAGALLGALKGTRGLPADWLEKLGPTLQCGIAVKHRKATFAQLANDTCHIGVEMAAARNPAVTFADAPTIAVRPPPPPGIVLGIAYPRGPTLRNSEPTQVMLTVENTAGVSTESVLRLTLPAHLQSDMTEAPLALSDKSRLQVNLLVRRKQPGAWLPDKNLFEVRWLERDEEKQRRVFGLGGARQWLVYGPYWDMWDKDRFPVCPYHNPEKICHPGSAGLSGDSYNQYVSLDRAYLDEQRLLREDFAGELPFSLELGEDRITETDLGGFKGQACYYFVRTFRSTGLTGEVSLLIGRTGPYRAWLDAQEIGCQRDMRAWAQQYDETLTVRLTGEAQRLVIKCIRLTDAMTFSALFAGAGDPEGRRGISTFLDCLEDLPPALDRPD